MDESSAARQAGDEHRRTGAGDPAPPSADAGQAGPGSKREPPPPPMPMEPPPRRRPRAQGGRGDIAW